MHPTQPSLDLLSHFDEPDTPRIEGHAAFIQPTRGVGWVLKWASALVVLLFSTTILVEFAYCLAGEQMLARAARAGVLEATLPRATRRSVEQSVWRRLERHVASPGDVKLALLQNGIPVGNRLQPRGGDQLAISLAVPDQTLIPNWLRTLTSWRGAATVEARAERSMPGRLLDAR